MRALVAHFDAIGGVPLIAVLSPSPGEAVSGFRARDLLQPAFGAGATDFTVRSNFTVTRLSVLIVPSIITGGLIP